MAEELFLPGKVCTQLRNWFSAVWALVLMAAVSVSAQTDQFGAMDRIYLDQVEAVRGQQVRIGVYMTNDEPIASISVPLTYNSSYLSLTSVSFEGSRGEYIATKMVAPEQVSAASGHFLTGVISITEDPIPAGDGLLFTAIFTLAANTPIGTKLSIDSLFYAPGGELLLIEAGTSALIRPDFSAGQVTATASNQPPVIQAPASVYVLEGDSLKLPVIATDINNDPIQLTCSKSVSGAVFTKTNGHGLFRWASDYLGANSADGSPFTIQFWATDGIRSTSLDVQVFVINKNRKPVVTLVDSVTVEAGQPLSADITFGDPDYDTTTLAIIGAPAQAQVGYSGAFPVNGMRQATFSWNTKFADSGRSTIKVVATDSHGAADTSTLLLHVTPTSIYNLSVIDTSVAPAAAVDIAISLENLAPLGSYAILLHTDPSILTVLSVANAGTRSAGFSNFSSTINYSGVAGDVLVQGIAGAQPLAAGSGTLFKIRVSAIGNVTYSGTNVPVRFVVSPVTVLKDSVNAVVPTNQIATQDGSVFITSLGNILLGDINLNQIAYDIGDAIYFTDFFINPYVFRMNPLQLANSDVNGDEIVPTIADLVTLIRVITGDATPISSPDDPFHASIQVVPNPDGTQTVLYTSEVELGAVLLTGTSVHEFTSEDINSAHTDMTVDVGTENSEERILVYSMQGNKLPSGSQILLTLPRGVHFSPSSIELSSADGQPVEVSLVGGFSALSLPTSFALQQNYPNPFNPSTNIDFDVAKTSRVRLSVYNLLGQEIRLLTDEVYQPGHHSVIWDSRDNAGAVVSSGVYFYRMETASESFTKKMMLVK